MFTLLSPAAVCVSIGSYEQKTVMMTIMNGVQWKWGYLSFSKQDVRDDVREAAAQH